MRLTALLAACLLASTLAAGCQGGGKGSADSAEEAVEGLGLKATDTTGVIRGIVVDEAVRPLAGAAIALQGQGKQQGTVTTEGGAFGFDGLEPGTYFLTATHAGFAAVQQSAEVVAGLDDPPLVRIQMAADASSLPYVTNLVYDAFIGCSLTTPSVSAAACDVEPVKGVTNNEFLVEYDADKPPQWIQSEAVWESTQALGSDLSLSLTDFSQAAQVDVNETEGQSPIHFTVNATVAAAFGYGTNNSLVIRLFSTAAEGTDVVPEEQAHAAYASSVYPALNGTGAPSQLQPVFDEVPYGNNPFTNEECLEYPILFDSCYRVSGVGVVVNQRVAVFTHIFYGYEPPAGWRFSDAGAAPPPPA